MLTKDVDSKLGLSAIQAAKRWRFEPARMDDKPVASDVVVRFRFGEANP
jgi:outer membrane biosynthesis protein TonB